jgi:hypothetical protein
MLPEVALVISSHSQLLRQVWKPFIDKLLVLGPQSIHLLALIQVS